MSGTSVTYVPGLYTHHLPVRARRQEGQGISFMAVGAYNVPGEPREGCQRRTPTGLLGNRVNNWTYPLFFFQMTFSRVVTPGYPFRTQSLNDSEAPSQCILG